MSKERTLQKWTIAVFDTQGKKLTEHVFASKFAPTERANKLTREYEGAKYSLTAKNNSFEQPVLF